MKSYNVLILVESAEESARIVSLFRDDAFPVRAHRVTSEEDFLEHIDEGKWHLFVSNDRHQDVPLPYCLSVLMEKELEIPVLLLADGLSLDDKVAMTERGVTMLVDKREEKLFLPAAKMAAKQYAYFLDKKALQVDYDNLLARTNTLLEETEDAVGYLAEGILIECNQNFAEKLGFSDVDDLSCISFVDLLNNQDEFKQFFKQYTKDNDKNQQVFQFLHADKSTICMTMMLKATTHHGEDCVQIIVTESLAEPAGDRENQTVSVYERLKNQHEGFLQGKNIEKHCLVLMQINHFNDLQRRLSFSGIQALKEDFLHLVREHTSIDSIYPLNDATLAFFYSEPPSQVKSLQEEFLQQLESYIFECVKASLSYTVTCQLFNLSAEETDVYIDRAFSHLMNTAASTINRVEIVTLEEKEKMLPPSQVAKSTEIGHETISILYQPIMRLRGEKKETYEVTYTTHEGFDRDNIVQNSDLDRWVIIEATKALSAHRANGHETRLLINLSHYVLVDTAFANWIKVVLKASDLPVNAMIFQFDETDILNNLKQAAAGFSALRDNDYLVAVTNFSEQASSLQLLKHIKPQFIHFNKELTPSLSDADIFDNVKTLLEKLSESNISAILSNVRSTAEMASLWQLGASYMTGSYLQEPESKMAYEFAELH